MGIALPQQPIIFSTQDDPDYALTLGMSFVEYFKARFDDFELYDAMSACKTANEREYFMLAVIGELRSLVGDD